MPTVTVPQHYLDNAATTRTAPEVVAAMVHAMEVVYANPAALHRAGVEADHLVDAARERVARAVGAEAAWVVFTSGGTEANNLALKGVLAAYGRRSGHLITTAVEHSSVLASARALQAAGYDLTVLPVNADGVVDLEELRRALRRDTCLVSVAAVNNEVGTIQPIRQVAETLAEARTRLGAPLFLHVDAVQALGKIAVDMKAWEADLLTISAHKIHGPKGIGALVVRPGVRLTPLLTGGEQEEGMRPGTHNVPGIVGFGEAARLVQEEGDAPARAIETVKLALVRRLREALPEAVINGPPPEQAAPHILNLSIPGLRGEFLVHGLAGVGVYVSTGSACTSRRTEPSHVLTALGLSPDRLVSAIRVSLSRETTTADVEALVEGLVRLRQEFSGIVRAEAPKRPRRTDSRRGSGEARPEHRDPSGHEQVVLVRYGEIGLKGDNRGYFERLLMSRLRSRLDGLGASIVQSGGRIWVRPHGPLAPVLDRLQTVFGVVALSVADRVPLALGALEEAVLSQVEGALPLASFKIDARRPNKQFPLTSIELNRHLGRLVQQHWPGIPVDVHRPALTVRLEVRDDAAYVWASSLPGPGGLPVGAGGRATVLLSGGFDSPVAAWMTMKRGMKLSLVYFHSYPFTSEQARDKVVRLSEVLARWGGPVRLHVVYFTEIQRAIQLECPPRLTITIMRRMMFRLAERIAARERALLLVTGESLGQVASQTPESLATISAVTTLPVLRPVIGMDKTEIMARAEAIGTYEISVLPFQDCCAVFQPLHPATKPRRLDAEKAEAVRDWSPLLAEALSRTEVLRIES
jgi:tRNA sulfurtransferase ThiI